MMLYTFRRVLLLLHFGNFHRTPQIYLFKHKATFVINSLAAFLQAFSLFSELLCDKEKIYILWNPHPRSIFFINTLVMILRWHEYFVTFCEHAFRSFSLPLNVHQTTSVLIAKFEQMLFYSIAINSRICQHHKISSFYCDFYEKVV